MPDYSRPPVYRQGEGGEDRPEQGDQVVLAANQACSVYEEEARERFRIRPAECRHDERKDWPIFVQLAVMCLSRGWDVSDYVRFALGSSGHSHIVYVKDLVLGQTSARYAERAKKPSNAEDEWRRCVESVIHQEMNGADERPLLLSPSSGLPAWFRVSYPETPDMDVLDVWGEAAKAEFASMPGRIEFVSNGFPEKWARLKRLLWLYSEPTKEGV